MNIPLSEKDKKYLWHPFTQMKDWEAEEPLIIEKGRGNYLYDIEGKRYFDGVSSLWVNVHGHRRKEIDDAIIRQVKTLSHSTFLGLSHPPGIELAERLVNIAPEGLKRVFYSDNGSTAIEIGLKMAFQYWKHKGEDRPLFLCLKEAYHGDTIGSVSVGGMELFHEIFKPLLFQTVKAATPFCYRCGLGLSRESCGMACADELERLMRENEGKISALVMEPLVQGAAGIIVHPAGYLARARELCDKYNILLVLDEVATGFGRTGRMFACQHEGVSPDILCLAKGITGGYLPLAATMTAEKIYEAFLGDYAQLKTFFHGHSYTANPLACAAAIANLDVFEKDETLQHMPEKEAALSAGLEKIKKLPHVGDVRRKGLMAGIELVKDKATKEPYPLPEKRGIRVITEARRRGLIIRPLGNVIVLMPPLSSTPGELRKLTAITRRSIISATL
ncbi:MAG: adenosylmethionine--8-amino-7-oxononanoate transaminase [Nitrospirota bacterium]